MALFSKNTKKEEKTTAAVSTATVSVATTTLLKKPRITEKATAAALESVYIFDVAENATKRDIIKAVVSLYKVTPRKVAIVSVPTKTVRNMRSGIRGTKGGGKKAYVYLTQGETISIH
ncbi:50S ribosomal protein L23 [Candidatus Kaiserbacteria bacterium]|nr:50S ribosomal protein L23 [Candidatus Kaiserbacteria bacterium]